MERCIHIFPEFKNKKWIDDTRKKHDFLHTLIEPHITIVFPFESKFKTKKLAEHMRQFCKVDAFDLVLDQLKVVDNYLYLLPSQGTEEIIALNEMLYDGILEEFKSDIQYIPHMTLGRFDNEMKAEEAMQKLELKEKFECRVKKITIERIKEDQSSYIEYHHRLKG